MRKIDRRLQLTKARLSYLRWKECSLFELAAAAVIKHAFQHDDEDYRCNISSLPKLVRASLLPRLTSLICKHPNGNTAQFEKMLKIFEALLSSKSTEIELNGLMTFAPMHSSEELLRKVIEVIAQKAPGVESLVINETVSEDEYISFEGELGRATVDALSSLTELKTLLITNCEISYFDLKRLCRKLRHLEHLEVQIAHMPVLDFGDEDEFKESFSSLKTFQFTCETEAFVTRLINYCLQLLPNLEIVQRRTELDAYEVPENAVFARESAALTHLSVAPAFLPFHLMYPRVSHLQINCERDDHKEQEIDALLNFPRIEFLFLDGSWAVHYAVSRFLPTYGPNLRSLKLNDTVVSVAFETIFDHCPRLERLSLWRVSVKKSTGKIGNLVALKEFSFKPKNFSDVFLADVLAAPNLEKFWFSCDSLFFNNDLAVVASLIGRRKILTKLKFLRIKVIIYHFMHCPFGKRHLQKISNLIKNASAFLPLLADFRAEFKAVRDFRPRSVFARINDRDIFKFLNAYRSPYP